jgi:hypothetical protein
MEFSRPINRQDRIGNVARFVRREKQRGFGDIQLAHAPQRYQSYFGLRLPISLEPIGVPTRPEIKPFARTVGARSAAACLVSA